MGDADKRNLTDDSTEHGKGDYQKNEEDKVIRTDGIKDKEMDEDLMVQLKKKLPRDIALKNTRLDKNQDELLKEKEMDELESRLEDVHRINVDKKRGIDKENVKVDEERGADKRNLTDDSTEHGKGDYQKNEE